MNDAAPHRPSRRRRPSAGRNAGGDLWRDPGGLPELQPVKPPLDVRALVRSLGDPPMMGSSTANTYFERVVERTASIAAALALSAGLLDTTEDDDED